MLYALDSDGDKLEASPGAKGVCPECEREVIPKCGDITIWHWAHKKADSCSFGEGETEWHLHWKKLVVPAACEVKIGSHRADIVGNDGIVIELQSSPIDTYQIQDRERTYKNMVWLFEAVDFKQNLDLRNRDGYYTFRWKWPRKSQAYCKAPLYWDFGFFGKGSRATTIEQHEAGPSPVVEMLRVKKLSGDTPCGGYGTALTKKGFIWKYLSKWLPGKAIITTKQERKELDEAVADLLASLTDEDLKMPQKHR